MPSRRTNVGFWLAPLGLVLFVSFLEYVVFLLYPGLIEWPGRLVLALIVLIALVVTFALVLHSVRRIQVQLEKRNQELLALQRANLDIYGELSLEAVLQRVVEQAAQLLGSRYGALSVVDGGGQVEQFLTYGISEEQRSRIGDPPSGRGLLGVPLREGKPLRVENLTADPRRAGVPLHHPEMKSLLAVPIISEHPFRGNLYVSEKIDGRPFDADDERTLSRFADQAALAIEKAFLHRQLATLAVGEERARIAREMHDGLAQVLAYVNTKAQAVREYLISGKSEQAIRQLDQLAEAARGVLAEVREGILALRTESGGERTFKEVIEEYLRQWREQTGIAVSATIPPGLVLDDTVELQLLRIIQEALSNVRKHSGVQDAVLQIERTGSGVSASVCDRGCGFDEERHARTGGPRFGLAIMRERAESVGGMFSIESTPGLGTTVRVELPAA